MNIKIRNLLLIGSIVISVILSSCGNINTEKPLKKETGTFTDTRDGKTYKWVKIGDQIWMAENLAYTGNDMQHITDNTAWNNTSYNGWCYYDKNSSNEAIYGVLYQWEAAKIACPSGWHLPTDDEWTTLIDYIGGEKAGGKMKIKGTKYWKDPNEGATNESGFSALPSGNRSFYNGAFSDLGGIGHWWSAEDNSDHSSSRTLNYDNTEVYRDYNYKSFGFSVRCVRN